MATQIERERLARESIEKQLNEEQKIRGKKSLLFTFLFYFFQILSNFLFVLYFHPSFIHSPE